MSSEPPETPPTAAQTRLWDLLGLLRATPPAPPARLTPDVIRAARFQRVMRTASLTVNNLGAAMLEGLIMLLGVRRRR